MMKYYSAIIILMLTISTNTQATEIIKHVKKGQTITADTIWNLNGKMYIKIVGKGSNCVGDTWWTGIKNKILGRKCGAFEVGYKISPIQVRSFRMGPFESDSMVYIKQDIKGINSKLYDSQWLADYNNAEKIYKKCGTSTSCWYKEL